MTCRIHSERILRLLCLVTSLSFLKAYNLLPSVLENEVKKGVTKNPEPYKQWMKFLEQNLETTIINTKRLNNDYYSYIDMLRKQLKESNIPEIYAKL